jgi:hypothetical protein
MLLFKDYQLEVVVRPISQGWTKVKLFNIDGNCGTPVVSVPAVKSTTIPFNINKMVYVKVPGI